MANVGIGLALFGETFSRFQDLTILMVYFGYLGVSLAIVTVLFFLFTIMACSSKEKGGGRRGMKEEVGVVVGGVRRVRVVEVREGWVWWR